MKQNQQFFKSLESIQLQSDALARTRSLRYVLVLIMCVVAMTSLPVTAATDDITIVYGGRLVLPTGAPVAGPLNLRVSFYHDASGGVPVGNIALTFDGVPFTDGLFQLELKMTPEDWHQVLPNASTTVYIEIENTSRGSKYPRQLYNVVPFAMKVPVDNKSISYNDKGQLKLNVIAPPASNGQLLSSTTDGSLSWITPASSGGSGTISGVTAGTGLTGGGTTGSVTLNIDAGTGANKIVQLDALGKLPAVDGSALTNIVAATIVSQGTLATANAVSGGTGGTITDNTVTNADINTAAAIDTSKLSGAVTSITGNGLGTAATLNVGAGINNIVQLDATAKMPAVDGSALTNLNASSLASGVVPNGRINFAAPGPIGGTTPGTGTFTAVTTDNMGVSLQDNDGTNNFVILKAPAVMNAHQTYTFPAAADAGKFMTTDSSGNLGWSVPSGAGDMLKSVYDVNIDAIIDLAAGGTGASTAAGARTNLGLGTVATFNVGTGATNIVQLDGSSKLPAIDGSAVTNVVAASITSQGALATLSAVSGGTGGTVTDDTITDADIKSNAAIARSKIAAGSANHLVINDGSGNFSSEAQLALSRGGVGTSLSGTGGANQFLKQTSVGGAVSVATITAADLPTLVGDSGGGGTKGAAPAPASGDAAAGKFLKADGTWAAPAGVQAGTNTQVQYNNSGAAGASADFTYNNSTKRLAVNGQYVGKLTSGASTTIDWDTGNFQKTTAAPGTITFTAGKMQDGSTYTLILTQTGTFTFSNTDISNWKCVPTCAGAQITTTGESILTFIKAGTDGYVAWVTGF